MGGDIMDIHKFYNLLISLYEEQEKIKIDYEIIFLNKDVSNG